MFLIHQIKRITNHLTMGQLNAQRLFGTANNITRLMAISQDIPGISRYQNVSILDFIRGKYDGCGDNWSYRPTCKAQSSSSRILELRYAPTPYNEQKLNYITGSSTSPVLDNSFATRMLTRDLCASANILYTTHWHTATAVMPLLSLA